MTLIWTALAVAAGVAIGVGGTLHWHPHRVDAHEYRLVRLEATRVDKLFSDYDHEARLRRRVEAELDRVRTRTLVWVGALVDELADRDRAIARLTAPRHRRRSPVPVYGSHRGAA